MDNTDAEKKFIKSGARECMRLAMEDGKLEEKTQEVFPIIIKYLTTENFNNDENLYKSCEEILDFICGECNPEEIIIPLLEQIETAETDIKFNALTRSLAKSLIKSGNNLGYWIASVVSTIIAYVEELSLPENKKPHNDTNNREQIDPAIKNLNTIYGSIVNFLQILIDHIAGDKEQTRPRIYLLHLHLVLFGEPFSHLDIDTMSVEPTYYQLSILQTSQLTGDLMQFFKFIDDRSKKRTRKLKYHQPENSLNYFRLSLDLFDSQISDLMYANYYFVLMTSTTLQNKIPQVYHPHYIMNSCLYLGSYLLQRREYILVSKGLRLITAALQRVEYESINYEFLELPIHMELFSNISQVMIHCDSSQHRKMALNVFKNYINCFSMRARYLVIRQLYETSNHSGLMALIINILKESIIQSLNETPHCEYFVGKNLSIMLTRICSLSHGSTTDLVEISDEIIAALNLLRFLVIRDKTDVTGIWTIIDSIQTNYLKPLREGIDMSRAHWRLKIKDLEEQKNKNIRNSQNDVMDDEVTVTVGGQDLPKMPVTEKIKFCYQALNALDIMESILIRVNECIEDNPINNFSQN